MPNPKLPAKLPAQASPEKKYRGLKKGATTSITNFHGTAIFLSSPHEMISLLDVVKETVELVMKKNAHFSGDFRGAVIFNDSTINNAGNIAGTLGGLDESARSDLQSLLGQIAEALNKPPAEKLDDAQAVASASEDFMKEAGQSRPNPKRLAALGKSFIDTAEAVIDFAPSVVGLAEKIVTNVTGIFSG